jgi:carbon monoxide dehydrogenase subunit G
MEIKGEQLISSPIGLVWHGLNDPTILKSCINGCHSLEATSASEFTAEIVAAVGPVKAKFKGNLTLTDIVPQTSYSLIFEGTGGPAGFVKGTAKVLLEDKQGSTVLAYSASFNIGGKLAQVGSRLVGGIAKSTAEDFFAKFSKSMLAYSPSTIATPPIQPELQSIHHSLKKDDSETEPFKTGVPTVSPQFNDQVAQAGQLVPVVVWLPIASLTEQANFSARRTDSQATTRLRDLVHPAWWVIGTAFCLILIYFAFLRP